MTSEKSRSELPVPGGARKDPRTPSPTFTEVGQRLGTLRPAPLLALPDLPNLPDLYVVYAKAETLRRTPYTREARKVGQVGKSAQ